MIRDSVGECVHHKDPLERPDYTEAEAQAIRALRRGDATKDQQIRALEYMIRAFGTHDISYRPGDPQGTAFAEGKRFAGTTLVWMLNSAPTKTDPDKISVRNAGESNG